VENSGTLATMSLIWSEILTELEKSVSRPNFVTWLKPTKLLGEQAGLIKIGVPNPYTTTWIEKNCLKEIKQALLEHYPTMESLQFVVLEKETTKSLDGLPLLEETDPSQTDNESSGEAAPSTSKPPPFNKSYNFENFIVGNNNRLAFAACQAVAEKPGEAYNPLFIYGGVGLGKTHLMQAIGNGVRQRWPKKNIVYTSCEAFTTDFVSAIQEKRINEFKNKYRKADVLLIDDIQFLANKEGTQEEFFHTFNILHQDNRQIVLTSDRIPKEMTELEDRLISRLGWGLIADIQAPNFENRVAILQAKAKEKNITVPADVLEYIASTITSNVRELEGSLIKLATAAMLDDMPITKEFTARTLKDILKAAAPNISGRKVVAVVADYFSVEPADILGTRRTKELVYPRQIVMYILREQLGQSFPRIGEFLGGKDHTTVMHGVNKISALKKTETAVEKDIQTIQGRFQ
ncbi:MAG: chromosomal replication initiator protein DnaA, partial [Patescibacteria group bacterium]